MCTSVLVKHRSGRGMHRCSHCKAQWDSLPWAGSAQVYCKGGWPDYFEVQIPLVCCIKWRFFCVCPFVHLTAGTQHCCQHTDGLAQCTMQHSPARFFLAQTSPVVMYCSCCTGREVTTVVILEQLRDSLSL